MTALKLPIMMILSLSPFMTAPSFGQEIRECTSNPSELGRSTGEAACEYIINGLVEVVFEPLPVPCTEQDVAACKVGMNDFLAEGHIFSKLCKRLIEKNAHIIRPFEGPSNETARAAWDESLKSVCDLVSP